VDPALNHVVLTGRIVADPQRDKSATGEPITILMVSFLAASDKARGSACCEVEVLDEVAEEHREHLRPGVPILISGELSRAGGIWAKLLTAGEPN
jgi:single-stranded DNA-binding protein